MVGNLPAHLRESWGFCVLLLKGTVEDDWAGDGGLSHQWKERVYHPMLNLEVKNSTTHSSSQLSGETLNVQVTLLLN